MQAYYEIETEIPVTHQLNIKLPDTIPVGRAKIAIIYEVTEVQSDKKTMMADFLNNLPDNPTGGCLTKDEIKTYIQQERSSWDD
ncbi:conserved hypothetical protein [Desulfamplus magnetovallimortis]|uniref:Uncharacterized protein n=1 Tax=Desulfamplus magnetovallimortis TaxID=1246637 RepID=A0A1W1H6T1_9BACT|nr:hypothetical protein [Desulfamplus magnetovallimortis]SLM28136.1 conserved hypothetical protein [Desulfamplus magnetovallimortis]